MCVNGNSLDIFRLDLGAVQGGADVSLLDIALAVAEHKPEPFIAPVPDANRVTVWSVQRDVTFRFEVGHVHPGWWRFDPLNQTEAVVSDLALKWEMIDILEALPRFYVIAVHRLGEGSWLVVPYNAADAGQRGWSNSEPRPMHIVRHSIEPFDVVVARSLAGLMLYDRMAALAPGPTRPACVRAQFALDEGEWGLKLPREFWLVWGLLKVRLEQARREEAERMQAEQLATTGGQIKWALDFMGAELADWTESGSGYRVTWTYDGYTHEARFTRNMGLDSAGICLGHRGEAAGQNLSSTVAVIQEARRRRRFDIDRKAWL